MTKYNAPVEFPTIMAHPGSFLSRYAFAIIPDASPSARGERLTTPSFRPTPFASRPAHGRPVRSRVKP
jgi:hypothetical protein